MESSALSVANHCIIYNHEHQNALVVLQINSHRDSAKYALFDSGISKFSTNHSNKSVPSLSLFSDMTVKTCNYSLMQRNTSMRLYNLLFFHFSACVIVSLEHF